MTICLNTSKQRKIVTRRQTAEILGYDSTASVSRLEKAGKLTAIRLNSRRTCYDLDEVMALMGVGR